MDKPLCEKKSPSEHGPRRGRRSVSLVFGRAPIHSSDIIKKLIDDGLARLIAYRIASDAASSGRRLKAELTKNGSAQESEKCFVLRGF
jgi:pyruvate/oxaloacetate carboxyltransferase